MASVSSLTRQISALEISSKPNTTSRPPATQPGHQKKPSQPNVTKLLSKYAAPNPSVNAHTITTTTLKLAANASKTLSSATPSPPLPAQPAVIDIGRYDGGFEIDNETRGEMVTGPAAEELALDSSVAL